MRFTKDHEYVRVDGAVGTVGISDYAQQQLGDVVFVELPAIGEIRQKGAPAAVVESVKAASDIYSPVGGEVVAVNDAVQADDQPDQRRRAGTRLVVPAQTQRSERTRRPDGRRRLRRISQDHRLSRRDALSASRRRRSGDAPRIGVADIDALFADIPADKRLTGLLDMPLRRAKSASSARSGDGRAQRRGGIGAVLSRRRRLSPPRPRDRRSSDPALRVLDQLHPLSTGNRARHLASAVRVSDPGRRVDGHGSRQRLDVRRLDRLRRGDADGASADATEKGDAFGRPASAICRCRGDAGEHVGRQHRAAAARSRGRARTSPPGSTTRRAA